MDRKFMDDPTRGLGRVFLGRTLAEHSAGRWLDATWLQHTVSTPTNSRSMFALELMNDSARGWFRFSPVN